MLIMFAWSLPLLTLSCLGSLGVIASLLLCVLARPLCLAWRLSHAISWRTRRCVFACLLLRAYLLLLTHTTRGVTWALPALSSPTLSNPRTEITPPAAQK